MYITESVLSKVDILTVFFRERRQHEKVMHKSHALHYTAEVKLAGTNLCQESGMGLIHPMALVAFILFQSTVNKSCLSQTGLVLYSISFFHIL